MWVEETNPEGKPMNLELNDECRATVVDNAAGRVPIGAVPPRPWHRPTVTIIDVKRTMAALGAYTDGGTGSSF
jgi:hypothetical protein